jgi:hypothetical protein
MELHHGKEQGLCIQNPPPGQWSMDHVNDRQEVRTQCSQQNVQLLQRERAPVGRWPSHFPGDPDRRQPKSGKDRCRNDTGTLGCDVLHGNTEQRIARPPVTYAHPVTRSAALSSPTPGATLALSPQNTHHHHIQVQDLIKMHAATLHSPQLSRTYLLRRRRRHCRRRSVLAVAHSWSVDTLRSCH